MCFALSRLAQNDRKLYRNHWSLSQISESHPELQVNYSIHNVNKHSKECEHYRVDTSRKNILNVWQKVSKGYYSKHCSILCIKLSSLSYDLQLVLIMYWHYHYFPLLLLHTRDTCLTQVASAALFFFLFSNTCLFYGCLSSSLSF